MDEKTVRNIELIWEYGGACPDQWYSYFYNEHSDKTYCATSGRIHGVGVRLLGMRTDAILIQSLKSCHQK